MEIRSRVFSGICWSTLSSISNVVVGILQLAVLGRLLGAEDFGLVAMAAVVLGIANIYADVGMSNAILTHHQITTQQLSSLYWLNWGASILAALVIWLSAPLAAFLFDESRLEPLIAWLAGTLLIAPLGLQYRLLLQKELYFKPISLIEVCSGFLGLAVSIVLAVNGQEAYSLVFGNLANTTFKAIALFFVGFKRWPITFYFAWADVKPYLGFGAYQLGERTLNFVAWNLDKLMIGGLLGSQALGVYNVAYQLMQKPLQFVTPIVSGIALPLFSSISDELAKLRSSYLLVIQGLGLLLFPVFISMFVLAEPIILFIVGPNWLDVVPVLRWLALLGNLYAIGFPVGSLLLARQRADIAFWLNIWALSLYGLAVFVGSSFGIVGVAIALFVVQIIGLFTAGFWVRWKVVNMLPMEFFRAFMPSLLIASVSGLITHVIGVYIINISGYLPLAISILFTIYLSLIMFFLRAPLMRVIVLYKNRSLDA